MYIAQMGHVDVVKYLLPGRCRGCLQAATENGFVEVVELLESEASLVRNDGKLRRFSEYKEF